MKVIMQLKLKTLFMKLSLLFFMVTAFTITSCAQDQKKPDQATTNEQPQNAAPQKIQISVDGMVCNACQSTVKKTIKSIDGVSDVEVNLEKKFALFTYDPQKVKVEQVQKAVNDKGFTAGKPQEVKQ